MGLGCHDGDHLQEEELGAGDAEAVPEREVRVRGKPGRHDVAREERRLGAACRVGNNHVDGVFYAWGRREAKGGERNEPLGPALLGEWVWPGELVALGGKGAACAPEDAQRTEGRLVACCEEHGGPFCWGWAFAGAGGAAFWLAINTHGLQCVLFPTADM